MAAAASLVEALRRRGRDPVIRTTDGAVPARDLLEKSEASPAKDLVVVCGGDAVGQIATALGAWRTGRSVYLLDPRQPAALREALVADVTAPSGVEGTLIQTSGSSGAPKVAVHTLAAHVEAARSAIGFFGLGDEDRWLLSLPLHHVGGLNIVMRGLISGAEIAVPSARMALPEALARLQPTHVSLVATQLRRLLQHGEADGLRRCRAVLLGGGPIPASLRARALEAGVRLVVSYGTTETTGMVAASDDPAIVGARNAAGPALVGRRVALGDDGEILVAGDGLFDGYLEDGHVVWPVGEDGFYATGDVGRLAGDGVLYVDGRKDRMIVSGGENIHPEEIEGALSAVPGVMLAVVVGVDDPEFGARPVAFVEGAVTRAGLEASLRERLPGFKVPDAFYAMPADANAGMKPDVAALERLVRDPSKRRSLEGRE